VQELETTPITEPATMPDTQWLAGKLIHYDNNSNDHAQFISHPSGNFLLWGETAEGDLSDTYAMPLLAGQTVTIDGGKGHMFIEDAIGPGTSFLNSGTIVQLYDADGRLLDTLGSQTHEDMASTRRKHAGTHEFHRSRGGHLLS